MAILCDCGRRVASATLGKMLQGNPNLYLIGFMGVGKSAVGRAVARSLDYRFIDSDAAIEEVEGRTIREIFEAEGEARFRDLELTFLEQGHPPTDCVVACGGGLPIPAGRAEILRAKGVVICLFASPQTIHRRTSFSNKRPLLDCDDPEGRIRDLLAVREPIYMQIGIGISAEGRTLDEVTDNVIRAYQRESRRRRAHS